MDLPTTGSIVNTEVEADVAAGRFGTQVLTPIVGLIATILMYLPSGLTRITERE